MGLSGFCVMSIQLVMSFETTYWTNLTMDVLLTPFRRSAILDNSTVLSYLASGLKDVPLGVGLIGCGMLFTVVGNFLLDLAKGRFYSRLLER